MLFGFQLYQICERGTRYFFNQIFALEFIFVSLVLKQQQHQELLQKQPQPLQGVTKQAPSERQAAKFIVDNVMENPNEVVLVCLGALTNIAIALQIQPKLKDYVQVFYEFYYIQFLCC